MRAGRLDRRVAVQRLTTTSSGSGEPVEAWDTIGGINRWASKSPITGIERYGSQQLEAKEQLEFRLRWSDELADLQPTDRIIEPADDAQYLPTPGRSTYDIIAVLEINRREGLRVLATRRLGDPAAATNVIRFGVGYAYGGATFADAVGEAIAVAPFAVGNAVGQGDAAAVGAIGANVVAGVGSAAGISSANSAGATISGAAGAAAGASALAMVSAIVRSAPMVSSGVGAAAAVGDIAWVNDFITPSGARPTIFLDFVNGRYYDGSTGTAALSSLLNNAAGKVDSTGLTIGGATNLTSNGAFTTAVQQSAGTIFVETSNGDGAISGIVAFTSGAPDLPIGVDILPPSAPAQAVFAYPTSLYTGNGASASHPWSGISRVASGWDGSGRRLSYDHGLAGGSATATDAVTYSARGQAVLGSYAGGAVFAGKIRRLLVYGSKLSANDMNALTWPSKYLLPLRRNHMIRNCPAAAYGTDPITKVDTVTLAAGALQFERSQPWTVNCEFNRYSTTAGEVIFTNVVTGPPWYGWEIWITDSGSERGGSELRVHLMSGWGGTGFTTHSLQVNSTTKINPGNFYRLQASYDGSSLASGVKIYLNGVLETNIVDHDTLDASLISGTAQMYLMSQYPGASFNLGWLGPIQISNIVRSGAYAAALATSEQLPAIDANHVLSFDMREGSGTTLVDRSASGFNGTLANAAGWTLW